MVVFGGQGRSHPSDPLGPRTPPGVAYLRAQHSADALRQAANFQEGADLLLRRQQSKDQQIGGARDDLQLISLISLLKFPVVKYLFEERSNYTCLERGAHAVASRETN